MHDATIHYCTDHSLMDPLMDPLIHNRHTELCIFRNDKVHGDMALRTLARMPMQVPPQARRLCPQDVTLKLGKVGLWLTGYLNAHAAHAYQILGMRTAEYLINHISMRQRLIHSFIHSF